MYAIMCSVQSFWGETLPGSINNTHDNYAKYACRCRKPHIRMWYPPRSQCWNAQVGTNRYIMAPDVNTTEKDTLIYAAYYVGVTS